MFILIVGAGRVGSAIAKRALDAGHEVSVLDSDPLSHERLDKDQSTTWEDAGGRFTVRGQRLYSLVSFPADEQALISVQLPPGVSAYDFTFG